MVIYLDAFIGLNFLVDLCLLLGVNRLSGHPPGLPRAAAAAALGGGYAGMCLLPGFRFLGSALWRAVSLALMSWTAFGLGRSAWSRCVLFVLLSMALGGMAVSLETGGWGSAVCALAVALLCRMGLRGGAGRELVPLELAYRGRSVRILALRDTGNTLRDPLTGQNVTVVSPEVGEALGIRAEVLLDPVGAMEPGIRLIPCGTVGGAGLLAAVRCERGGVVAFAREPFGNGEYQGLIGGYYG